MRAQVVAKRLVLCDGLCLAGGHEDAQKLADWRHWSASDMRGRDARGLFQIPQRTRDNPDGPRIASSPRSSTATGCTRTCVGAASTTNAPRSSTATGCTRTCVVGAACIITARRSRASRAATGFSRTCDGNECTTTARRSRAGTSGTGARVGAARTTTARRSRAGTSGARVRVGGARTTTVRRAPSAAGGARSRGGARIGGAAFPVRPIRLRRSSGHRRDRPAATPPVHQRARPRDKPVAAALDNHVVQNCDGFRG